MKFAHIGDLHLGSWRKPEMQSLNVEAFEKAINRCINEKVDFILLCGDLFDTALPSIDILKSVAGKLRQLKEEGIDCYIIPGSHDYSVSGKSMISVLEKAGLCINVDKKEVVKNNVLFFGLAGRKGSLEQQELLEMKEHFRELNEKISEEGVMSILLLHTSIREALPEKLLKLGLPSVSLKDLPSGFDYYALGHLHNLKIMESEDKLVAYTGSLFPTNFYELEQQHTVNFFIVEQRENEKITRESIKQISEEIKKIINLKINATDENPTTLKEKILKELEKNKKELRDAVVTLRIFGTLKSGKLSEVNFQAIEEKVTQLGVYCLLRNTAKLDSKEFELKIEETESTDIGEIEQASLRAAIKEKIITSKDKELVQLLMKTFGVEKVEGETVSKFVERLTEDVLKSLDIEEVWK